MNKSFSYYFFKTQTLYLIFVVAVQKAVNDKWQEGQKHPLGDCGCIWAEKQPRLPQQYLHHCGCRLFSEYLNPNVLICSEAGKEFLRLDWFTLIWLHVLCKRISDCTQTYTGLKRDKVTQGISGLWNLTLQLGNGGYHHV